MTNSGYALGYAKKCMQGAVKEIAAAEKKLKQKNGWREAMQELEHAARSLSWARDMILAADTLTAEEKP